MATTCDEEPFHLDSAVAPAQEESAGRGWRLRPPDWRYRAAKDFLVQVATGAPTEMPSDPVVHLLIRAMRPRLRHSRRARQGRRLVETKWPVVDEVLFLGTDGRRSARTAEIEACLIKGWTHEETRLAGCDIPKEVYALYAQVFFDLDGARTINAWINDFLLAPELWNKERSLLRSRLLAFHGGGKAGIRAAIIGELSGDDSGLMRAIQGNERQKRIFDYVVGKANIEPGLYASLMETALKGADERAFQEHMKDREAAGSGSLEELAQHMEDGIKAFSQHELQPTEASGLDFVNQYIKQLTRNDNDGKKDIAE
jgi:hypothetical protein